MSDEFIKLLTEIRDVQREQLQEYRRVSEERLQLQRQAVQTQGKMERISIPVVATSVALFLFLVIYAAKTAGLF